MKGRMLALGALGLGISFLATAAPAAAQVGTAAPRMLSTVNAANPAVQRAARAQQVARSRAGRIEVARGARRGKAPGHARRRPSQQYVVIKVAPTFNGAIAIANAMAFNTAMQGWKPLTTGATGGGPELVRINDQLFLVVAAPDGAVHSPRIDERTLDILPTSWRCLRAAMLPARWTGRISSGPSAPR